MGGRGSKPKSVVYSGNVFACHTVLVGGKGVGKQTFLKKFNGGIILAPLIGGPGTVELSESFGSRNCTFEISNFYDCEVGTDFKPYLEGLGIPFTPIFILSYSITDKMSFEKQIPQLRDYILKIKAQTDNTAPSFFILVGFKADAESERQVSTSKGEQLAKEYGCPFLEVSTFTGANYVALFEEIVLLSRRVESMRSKK